MRPENAIYFPWILWAISWVGAAFWANRTEKRPGRGREWPYRTFEFGGFFCLLTYVDRAPVSAAPDFQPSPLSILFASRLWQLSIGLEWAMVGLAAAGFLFCWWARLHLGRLWSGFVTRKEGHRIIDTGPYAIVRHPIYTGVITAGIATAAIKATPVAVLGVLLLIAGYILKGQLEERFLGEELGTESYDAYRRRVPMLIPFAPR